MINRRGLITGLIAFTAAPAIVRAESLMKIKVIKPYTKKELEALYNKIMHPFFAKLAVQFDDRILYSTNDVAVIRVMYDQDFIVDTIANDRFYK